MGKSFDEIVLFLAGFVSLFAAMSNAPLAWAGGEEPEPPAAMERIVASGDSFQLADSGKPFKAWGFNYDHDADGRLLEDYWIDEWPTVEADFREMKALGANCVRIHPQFNRFMNSPEEPNAASLERLGKLIGLAEETGLYLDITGLGCYHKKDTPEWYDNMDEADRWDAQARFWEAVASAGAGREAVFCYDLMNEPILPGAGKTETEWLAGELGGKHFVQRLTLDLKGRTREQAARAWVDRMAAAIRKHDRDALITVGVIPWALVFPGAKPLFHSKAVGENLDFAAVHFYPETGKVDEALNVLKVYDTGKPLVIEEMFPLKCGVDELGEFIDRSRPFADGWIGFYWGKTIEEYGEQPETIAGAITRKWLELFRKKAGTMGDSNP